MAEFQWWLLLLGLVAGGGIVAVVYLDSARREQDIADEELPAEALLISERLSGRGLRVDAATVEEILLEHRAYKAAPPPDRFEPVESPAGEPSGRATPGGATSGGSTTG